MEFIRKQTWNPGVDVFVDQAGRTLEEAFRYRDHLKVTSVSKAYLGGDVDETMQLVSGDGGKQVPNLGVGLAMRGAHLENPGAVGVRTDRVKEFVQRVQSWRAARWGIVYDDGTEGLSPRIATADEVADAQQFLTSEARGRVFLHANARFLATLAVENTATSGPPEGLDEIVSAA